MPTYQFLSTSMRYSREYIKPTEGFVNPLVLVTITFAQ
jgi:hypothetical protein